jgi:hypothetical protein
VSAPLLPVRLLAIGRLPSEPFRTVMKRLLASEGYCVEPGDAYLTSGLLPTSSFARHIGLHEDTIRDMLHGKGGRLAASFDFNNCDKIMCAFGGITSWLTSELREQYLTINLMTLEERLDALDHGTLTCENGLHIRTRENTQLRVGGREMKCRECNNAKDRARALELRREKGIGPRLPGRPVDQPSPEAVCKFRECENLHPTRWGQLYCSRRCKEREALAVHHERTKC